MDDLFLSQPASSRFVREHAEPGIEVRVNFGVFAGRHATPAEIDEFAMALRGFVPSFSIVSEERHEFEDAVEASVHQVVVELPREVVGEEPEILAEKIVLAANGWALVCIASRHGRGV